MVTHARLANESILNAALQRRQSDQMDIFLSLMAQIHKLLVQAAATALSPSLLIDQLDITNL